MLKSVVTLKCSPSLPVSLPPSLPPSFPPSPSPSLKVFVGEVIEEARQIMIEWNEQGTSMSITNINYEHHIVLDTVYCGM